MLILWATALEPLRRGLSLYASAIAWDHDLQTGMPGPELRPKVESLDASRHPDGRSTIGLVEGY